VVVEAVRSRTPESTRRAGELRAQIDRFPFHAAVKRLLVHRGVPMNEAVRTPLRSLTPHECDTFDALVPSLLATETTALPVRPAELA
jgi:dihydrodipicolinate synthase/N-acetylneuraminate lyase